MTLANAAFGLYMEHSYRYYEMDQPLISDAAFDALCKALLDQWSECTHRYKWLADEDALRAGTGFQMVGKLHPAITTLCESNPSTELYKVYNIMAFADEYEEKAHGVICMLKFGGVGGSVDAKQLRQVADYLRGRPLVTKPLPLPPVVKSLPPIPPPPLAPLPPLNLPPQVDADWTFPMPGKLP